ARRREDAMASRSQVLLVMLLFTLAGCAQQAPKTAQPPTAPAPSSPPATATSPSEAPATKPPAPSTPTAGASPSRPSPTPAPAPGEPSRTPTQEYVEEPALKDVFFDPGHTEIGRQGTVIMKSNAGWLTEHTTTEVLIEGHSDWKGTPEANMAVGVRRAMAAKDFLGKAGGSEARLQIVSYGSDRLVCPPKTEACAAQNRRGH